MSKLAKMHEKLVIHEFVSFEGLNKNGKAIYPPYNTPPINSPDCIVQRDDGDMIWIEESEVFSPYFVGKSKKTQEKNGWREECYYNFPEDGKEYRFQIVNLTRKCMHNKDANPDYPEHCKRWGKGILLLKIACPFFDYERDFDIVKAQEHYADMELKNFAKVYIALYGLYQIPRSLMMQWPRPSWLIWKEK